MQLLSQCMTSPHIPQSMDGLQLAQSTHAQKNELLQSSPALPYRGWLSEARGDGDHLRKDRHFAMATRAEHALYDRHQPTHVPPLYPSNHFRDNTSHSRADNQQWEIVSTHCDLRPLAPLRVYSLPSPPVPGSPSPDSNLPNKPASTAAEDREPPQSAHGQKKKPHPNEPVALGILRALDTEDRERYTHIQKKTSHRMRQHDFSERCIPPCRVRQLVIGVHRRSWKKVHNLQRPIKGNLTKVQLIRGEGEVFGILVKTSTMKARKKRIKRMTPSGE